MKRFQTALAAAALFVCPLAAQEYGQGALTSAGRECPLRHTSVNADIAGLIARVRVTQEFRNSLGETIEAVYTFPLPHDAAVDEMTMTIGARVVRAKIRTREEARSLYRAAREAGQAAALLEQQRPNIFRQAVANIPPGAEVKVSLAYTQTLGYEDGRFEFHYPMTIGPRYSPAGVRDARRIAPPVAAEGARAGHDISIEVALEAGVPLAAIGSTTHEVDVQRLSPSRAVVKLRDQATIPNKDFLLGYENAGDAAHDVALAHYSRKGGYFALLLEPPRRIGVADVSPKELIFVLDTSGSMMGFPVEKAKEAMRLALDGLYPRDTFNLITFSGDTEILFPAPVPATEDNLRIARLFLASRSGRGGTEMMKAIQAALAPSEDSTRTRVVCFMTDGFVGNEAQILAEIQQHPEARVFAFGIGSSVNRFLLDGLAYYGRGEVEYVGLRDDGSAAARRFHQRVRDPLMTDLEIDWGGLNVAEVYPKRLPDLFGAKPVVVMGRYSGPVRGTAKLRGKTGGFASERAIAVDLPAAEPKHDAIASLWARRKIADLVGQDYVGAHFGTIKPELREQITRLGLEHQLMTDFTSLVAVEERVITSGGKKRRIEVPLEMPEGVSHEGVQGRPQMLMVVGRAVGGVPGGVAGGVPGGVLGGTVGSVPSPVVVPRQFDAGGLIAPPPAPRRIRVGPEEVAYSSKLDPELVKLAAAPTDGEVAVKVLLSASSPAILMALRRAGLTVVEEPSSGLMTAGRIAASRIKDLAAVPEVRYIVLWKPGP